VGKQLVVDKTIQPVTHLTNRLTLLALAFEPPPRASPQVSSPGLPRGARVQRWWWCMRLVMLLSR
jgi:hypothetical protein